MVVRSGTLFSMLRLVRDSIKLLVIRSREVAVPKRLLYIEVINPDLSFWLFYIACGCFRRRSLMEVPLYNYSKTR